MQRFQKAPSTLPGASWMGVEVVAALAVAVEVVVLHALLLLAAAAKCRALVHHVHAAKVGRVALGGVAATVALLALRAVAVDALGVAVGFCRSLAGAIRVRLAVARGATVAATHAVVARRGAEE